MNRLLGLLTACLLCPLVLADNPAPPDPCSTNPPTTASCWDCFKNLLADCDRTFNNNTTRQACYNGANTFYTACLTRAWGPAPRVGVPGAQLNADGVATAATGVNTFSGVTYSLVIGNLDFDSVAVTVRDLSEKGEPREQTLEVVVNKDWLSGDKRECFIATSMPPSINGEHVGVVTAFMKGGQVVGAYAEVVPVIDGRDLNGDGQADLADVGEAAMLVEKGTWPQAEFERFLVFFTE